MGKLTSNTKIPIESSIKLFEFFVYTKKYHCPKIKPLIVKGADHILQFLIQVDPKNQSPLILHQHRPHLEKILILNYLVV